MTHSPRMPLAPDILAQAAQVVIDLVRRNDYVSMVEIQRALEPHIPVTGNAVFQMPDLNIVLWAGVTEEFGEVMASELVRNALDVKSCPLMVYWIDGTVLNFPVAERLPKSGRYRQPHWAPVVFRIRQQERRPLVARGRD